jgi:hypothetical protein
MPLFVAGFLLGVPFGVAFWASLSAPDSVRRLRELEKEWPADQEVQRELARRGVRRRAR